ncbi:MULTISPECIES: glycosyltransferase family 4 protein [unclassified Microbacterium]|uniref:glycosyltransferase family 4 protein n=1 Tax=unclassified Microbacterium TaxID=2609290 RepID=UPI00109CC4D5|nr:MULTISPECIES: glycosyltransferase family 4 protein [unclassified Microbacterium]
MKIAIVSQYFPPDKPGRITDELSQELARRGHSVRVITAFPHYDGGKLAPGYRQSWRHQESRGSVAVRRVPIFASHSRNALGRIANYLSFPISARVAGAFVKQADVIYVHGTPATAAHAAYVWSRRFGIPYLYHVQDIWPESVTGSGFLPARVSKVADRAISSWLSKVYARAAAVVAIAPSAQRLFEERGARPESIHLVYNWARDADGLAPASGTSRDGLTLLYAGNLGALQDLETLLAAVARVADLDGVRLRIAGAGVLEKRLKDLTVALDLGDRVEFLGRLGPDEMAAEYAHSDFQIVPLKDLEVFRSTIPSKFQAGLAHRVPIITTVQGDVSDLVAEHRLGFVARPQDEESLEAAIREAYGTTVDERDAFRERASAFYDQHLTKQQAVNEIEAILTAIRRAGEPR